MIQLIVTLDTDLDDEGDVEQYAQWIADQFPFSVRVQRGPDWSFPDPEILVVIREDENEPCCSAHFPEVES
jgi:hypothetical protein